MIVVGIDPGITGGMAALCDGEVLATAPLPIHRDLSLAWVHGGLLRKWLRGYLLADTISKPETVCVIERVGPMRGASDRRVQGIASTFKFGVGFGSILSIVQAMECKMVLVVPAVWKRSLDLLKCDKSQSLVRARQLYPKAYLPKPSYEGQAEALLIAHWYLEKWRAAQIDSSERERRMMETLL